VLIEGNTAGLPVTVRPMESSRNVRLVLAGECAPGDVLVVTVDGTVQVLPTDAGTFRPVAIAEESGLAGSWVLARPAALGVVVNEGDLGV
jgi:hypothetical protein